MFTKKIHNEEEILSLVMQGDETAFTKLFDHYRDKIYGVALKLSHSTTIAEEIVADVFLKIWQRRNSLGDIENFNAYLFTITRNDIYRVLRSKANNCKVSELNDAAHSPTNNNAEDYVMDREYGTLLNRAIEQLPNQQKKVYKLIKEQNMKREAVASMLQIHPETVKFHLAQAMKNIRNYCLLLLKSFVGITAFLSTLP